MKAVRLTLAGRERHLAYTVEAMFQLEELFGEVPALIDAVSADDREGFQAACRAAAVLAEQGELARRHMGYEPLPLPSLEDVAATTAPSDLPGLRSAIVSAISLGFGREIDPEDDEVDLGLAELNEQKKRGNADALPQDWGAVRVLPEGNAAGLSRGDRGRLGAVFAGPRRTETGRGGGIEPGISPRPLQNISWCAICPSRHPAIRGTGSNRHPAPCRPSIWGC